MGFGFWHGVVDIAEPATVVEAGQNEDKPQWLPFESGSEKTRELISRRTASNHQADVFSLVCVPRSERNLCEELLIRS